MKKTILMLGALGLLSTGSAKAQWSVTPEFALAVNHKGNSSGVRWLPSWRLGVGVDYDFTERWAFSSGLFLTERRKNDEVSGYYGFGEHYNGVVMLEYMQVKASLFVPLMGKLYFPVDDWRFFVAAGPYIGYCFSDKIRNWESLGPTDEIQSMSVGTKTSRYFDWGAVFRFGVEANKWTVSMGYDVTLSNPKMGYADERVFDPVHALSLSVGYKFQL